MAEQLQQGIQATLFDYFQDTEYFTLQEANELVLEQENRDVNTESIRARIYEGINKGLFERVGKGLYTVTRKDEQGRENTCMLINGDGRDLSMIPDNSIDALITDHPYDTKKSLKGGNRDFANYELFQYNEKDFQEKLRVLKPGCFLVEFLPEENGDNYEYLYKVKDLARAAGFEYYAKVPWKKGDFVANTGRKSKNTEDICFFTKGKARELRPDAKKNKAEKPVPENIFECDAQVVVNPVNLVGVMGKGLAKEFKEKYPEMFNEYKEACLNGTLKEGDLLLYKAQDKWILNFPTKWDWRDMASLELIEKGLQNFVDTYEERGIKSVVFPKLGCGLGGLEWSVVGPLMHKYLDNLPVEVKICGSPAREHFMSGAAGMLPTVFDFGIDKKTKIHQAEKPVELLQQILRFVTKEDELVLDQFAGSGSLGEAALKSHRDSILIEKDVETYNLMRERISALGEVNVWGESQQKAINIVIDAVEAQADGPEAYDAFVEHTNKSDVSFKDATLELWKLPPDQPEGVASAIEYAKKVVMHEEYPRILECSSRGDKRFSSLYAKVCINGKEKSVEEWYQNAKRTADGKKAGKGKPFDYIIDPFTGSKLSVQDAPSLYRGLWITYLKNNPELVKYAEQFDEFTDSFYDPGVRDKQIKAYEADPFNKEAEFFYNNPGLLCGADVIGAYVKGDRERYVGVVKCSRWYKNMVNCKKSLSEQISDAQGQKNSSVSAQDSRVFEL